MADKIAFLSDPRNHPEHPELVEARETHMSWVFLGDHQVYKIKKPVRQPALDLRTLAARRRNAAAEIELNRRLAPDVYRGVLPLTFAPGQGLALGGAGEPAEWVVAMRRLPEDLMLDRALREGGPEPRDLQRIVRRLCRFYGSRTPVRQPPRVRRSWFEQEIDLSRRTLERFGRSEAAVERVAGYLKGLLRAREPNPFADRHLEGRIVEGHGDLRPEHICLADQPVIIDCLEFSRRMRLVDPADELAFLALECAMLGDPEAGARLQRSYEEESGDRPPDQLLAFYGSFRAFLRARLMALHSLEPGQRAAEEWLARADRYLELALAYAGELP